MSRVFHESCMRSKTQPTCGKNEVEVSKKNESCIKKKAEMNSMSRV